MNGSQWDVAIMNPEFPPAVPEIPVRDINRAAEYYEKNLGFTIDWGNEEGGIAGISKGHCRIFLTNPSFRETYGNSGPVLIWFNLSSRDEVNQLYEQWKGTEAGIVSEPEAKPWKLHEFTARDLDGNLLRVFYDFSRDV
jgi:predicted lactoylglutathione lyase